jgi:hypothetical protein
MLWQQDLGVLVLNLNLLQDLATAAAGQPLQPKQLSQALGVAQALADVLGSSGGGATAGSQALLKSTTQAASSADSRQGDVVLVPDESGVMRPTADLAFDDAPWLDGPNSGGREGAAVTCQPGSLLALLFQHNRSLRSLQSCCASPC